MSEHRSAEEDTLGADARPRRRRATTAAPIGTDPNPTPEKPRHRANENDDQLKADVPPHWG